MTAETADSTNSYGSGSAGTPESGPSTVVSSELRLASRSSGPGHRELVLSVPGMHCGACVHAIEKALAAVEGVQHARANLTARRVTVRWREADNQVPPLLEALARNGFQAHLPATVSAGADNEVKGLLRALAVAGFGAGNIMLLSVSIWSGADPETRDLFHWISAAIALPVLAYSGQPFFRPAIAALRNRRTNMDVPISIGVLLACALSLYDTVQGREHAYFDAAVSLVFFLLAGRTLEAVMRDRAGPLRTGSVTSRHRARWWLETMVPVPFCPSQESLRECGSGSVQARVFPLTARSWKELRRSTLRSPRERARPYRWGRAPVSSPVHETCPHRS